MISHHLRVPFIEVDAVVISFDSIDEHAQREPDEVALIDSSAELSWREVADRTTRTANALLELDFPEGSRLAVLGHNTADTLLVYAAAARAGGGCCGSAAAAPGNRASAR